MQHQKTLGTTTSLSLNSSEILVLCNGRPSSLIAPLPLISYPAVPADDLSYIPDGGLEGGEGYKY